MWEFGVMAGMVALTGYWVFQPLLQPRSLESVAPPETKDRRKALQHRKEEIYAAIKEMEFDHGMGKISEEDLQELTSQYKAQALEILKEADLAEKDEDVEGEIEKEVQRLRAKKRRSAGREDDHEPSRQINFCPRCGKKLGIPLCNFCPSCGEPLGRLAEGRV